MSEALKNFYVTGGTLRPDAPSYVERQADNDLYDGLKRGEFCYALTSRQMGKSSLMVRTVQRLREEGIAVAVLDFTAVGQNLTVEQWYEGLLLHLGQQLGLEDELEALWLTQGRLGPLQRWTFTLEKVVLAHRKRAVAIFMDEIDVVRSLPFSTDEFFAAIRECYNRRSRDPEFNRLTFCLLGVAAPSDLIRDTRMTPFNIGLRIELNDFTVEEALPLTNGLGISEMMQRQKAVPSSIELLQRILYWTGGHPYLTQRLCRVVAEQLTNSAKMQVALPASVLVDRLCDELFLSPKARERDDNLLFVRERMLRADVDAAGLLTLYGRVRARKEVPDDETNPLVSVLRLAGITRSVGGKLCVRNRIYECVFDLAWVKVNMPEAEVKRQRAAFRRGLLLAGAGVAAVLVLLAGLVANSLRLHPLGLQQTLADGTVLTLESVTYGSVFSHHYEPGRFRTAWISQLFAGRNPSQAKPSVNRYGSGNLLVYWITRRDTNTGQYLSLDVLSHAEAHDQHGCPFHDADHKTHHETGWNSGGSTFPVAPAGATFIIGSAEIAQFPRREKTFRVELFDTNFNPVAAFTVPNPAFKSHPSWLPETLPATRRDGDLSITLTALGWRQSARELEATRDTYQFMQNGQPTTDWEVGGDTLHWSESASKISDATGNTGDRRSQLCPYETAWKLQSKFIRKPEATFASNEVWTVPSVAVAASGVASPIQASTKLQGVTLQSLCIGGRGKYRYENGVPKSLPITEDQFPTVGGSSWGFNVTWSGQNWYLEFAARESHVAVQANGLKDNQRLSLSAVDEQGRRFLGRLSHLNPRGQCVFVLDLAPDAQKVDLIFTLQKCRTAEFFIKPPPQWGRPLPELTGHVSSVWCVAFSPDGKTLAAASGNWEQRASLPGEIKLWNVTTWQDKLTLKGHTSLVYTAAFSPDNKTLVTGSYDQTLKVWDAVTGTEQGTIRGHSGPIAFGLAFLPDGKRFVSASLDGTVKVWNLDTRQAMATFRSDEGGVVGMALERDGKRVAAAAGAKGSILLWEVATGQRLPNLTGHTAECDALAFSPDGRFLASGSRDRTAKLWNLNTGQTLATFSDFSNWVNAVAFTPDGKTVAAADGNGTLSLWDTTSAQQIAVASVGGPGYWSVTFSPDGKTLAAGTGGPGRVKLWSVARAVLPVSPVGQAITK